jgi:hypothetical protein
MPSFNGGQPYHGSESITRGRLKGATGETDYFYFFCPKCPNDEIVRILEYGVHAEEAENPYNDTCKSKAPYGFALVFKLYCEKCSHTDFVKVANTGWQGGTYSAILARFRA